MNDYEPERWHHDASGPGLTPADDQLILEVTTEMRQRLAAGQSLSIEIARKPVIKPLSAAQQSHRDAVAPSEGPAADCDPARGSNGSDEAGIVFDPNIRGGEPVVRGTRISPYTVAMRLKAAEPDEVLDEDLLLHIPPEGRQAVKRRVQQHPRRPALVDSDATGRLREPARQRLSGLGLLSQARGVIGRETTHRRPDAPASFFSRSTWQ